VLLLAALQSSSGQTQGGADFYQGKTLRIVISTGVAGGFGEYARLLSEHIGKHIAGRPQVIVQSMPGAGSTRLCHSRRSGAARARVSTP
jgi:tripartite-type tricarboxylate transporter receptor subunit TctC